MADDIGVRRLDLGLFVRPAAEAGEPHPRVEPVLAYLVRHERGLILFDTGIGAADPETEAHYRPHRRELRDALASRYRELDGEAEVWPGVWIVPTPGHTAGHQSLAVRQPDGTVVLACQAHDFASRFASAQLARHAARQGVEQPLPPYPQWLDRLAAFDPRRVLFAHDASVWEPAELPG